MVQFCLTLLAAGLLAACSHAPARHQRAGHASGHPHGHEAAASPEREALLDAAENFLTVGAVGKALSALESAAQMAHAADTEMMQIRAMLAAGDYRHAIAFAAHTAGAHVDEGITPTAQYAWLLHLGGQREFASRLLAEALTRDPDDPLAREVDRQLHGDSAPWSPEWLEPPHRLAPYQTLIAEPAPPERTRFLANGVAWDEGRQVLTGLDAVRGADGPLWVRNGLGQTVPAVIIRTFPDLQLALLQLPAPLPNATLPLARREPFAGSAGFVADYPAAANGAPAWPRLNPGFLGGPTLRSPLRRLGIPLAPGPRGAPVFDTAGHFCAIALQGTDGNDMMVTIGQILAALGVHPAGTNPPARSASLPLDEGFEWAMRTAVQVIGGLQP